jgi:tRNA (guanine-N7-)-methyltransferase
MTGDANRSGDDGASADRRIRSYVIRSSRMRDAQRRAIAEYGPGLMLPSTSRIVVRSVFGNENPLVAEIGFGTGEATLSIARSHPDTNYVAIEVHRPGIGRLLNGIADSGLTNLRVIQGDAGLVVPDAFADGSIAGFHLFFPDPWPKKRHHKRRLMQDEFAALLARKLVSRGYIYFVTDWQEYAEWARHVLSRVPELGNPCGGYADRAAWRPKTKFELRGEMEGRPSFNLYFVKNISTTS